MFCLSACSFVALVWLRVRGLLVSWLVGWFVFLFVVSRCVWLCSCLCVL